MLCLKSSHKIGLFISSLVFFAALSVLFFSNTNVSAISDYTESITTTSGDFFTNCNLACIQQYRYLILDWTPVNSNNFIPLTANFVRDGSGRNAPIYINPWFSSHFIIDISDVNSVFTWDGTPPSGLNLVATLTESYTSCPEPEEPEPCPVVPENPYDEKFDGVIRAIYVCAGVMLVLYFFYCIYRMIIKSMGGN